MRYLLGQLFLFGALFGLALFLIALALLPMLVFHKVMGRVTALEKRGDAEGAYRLAQRLLHVTRPRLVRKAVGKGSIPLLFLQTARLAETLGELNTAMEQARQVSDGAFENSYRSMALQYQAALFRKQNRNMDAEAVEAQALALPVDPENHDAAPGADVGETVRITILYSQGRFCEALERINATSQGASDVQRIAFAEQKAIVFRSMGDYDEALVALQEVETRFEAVRRQWGNSRATNTTINALLRKQLLKAVLINRLTRIQLCLGSGKVGAAGETWDGLPAEVVDDDTEELRYATGAWLFAARGNEETARRLLVEMPSISGAGDRKAEIQALVGRTLFTLRDYDAAAKQFQTAIAGSAGKPLAEAEYRSLFAACHAKQEQFDLARAEWEAVGSAGFEEAAFTQEARTRLARLRANDAADVEPVRLAAGLG